MKANRAGQDYHIAGLDSSRVGGRLGQQQSHPARGDVDSVSLAMLHHLGVASDQFDPRFLGRPGHRLDDPLQVSKGKALLENEGGRHPACACAARRQVIDGAVHDQRANVPTWKERRADDEAVRRESKLP